MADSGHARGAKRAGPPELEDWVPPCSAGGDQGSVVVAVERGGDHGASFSGGAVDIVVVTVGIPPAQEFNHLCINAL